jgi:hypothetical protein
VEAGAVGEDGGEAGSKGGARHPFVQPKGRGAAVHHLHPSDGAVEGEAVVDDLLEEGGGAGSEMMSSQPLEIVLGTATNFTAMAKHTENVSRETNYIYSLSVVSDAYVSSGLLAELFFG